MQPAKGGIVENGYLEFDLPGNAEVVVNWRTESSASRRGPAERNGSLHAHRSKRKNASKATKR
jgi:hypothetical protein